MMLKPYDPSENENETVPPQCRATVDLIQRALDGEETPGSLDADPHAAACPACRERVLAARVLLSVLSLPREPAAVPANFSDRVVKAMWEDRHARTRRNVYKATAWLALAAAILIGLYTIVSPPQPDVVPLPDMTPRGEFARQPDVAPAPRAKEPGPAPAPEPRPIHIGDEVAKAEQKLLEVPKPLTDSVAVAPKLFEAITNPFKMPAGPPDPMATALEPARKSLTELPLAARVGLEPVTGTAEKAFKRFLHDVGSVKPNS
jgi:hypothetical protein